MILLVSLQIVLEITYMCLFVYKVYPSIYRVVSESNEARVPEPTTGTSICITCVFVFLGLDSIFWELFMFCYILRQAHDSSDDKNNHHL